MLEKEVKQYKRGNSFTYRIDLSKKDEFEGGEKVMILRLSEYESLQDEIEDLKAEIDNQNNAINELKEKRSEANSNINDITEEHNQKIAQKNQEIIDLIEENKASLQKCYDTIDEKDQLLQQANEEIRIEREKTDAAKAKAQDDILKERKRHDEIVNAKDIELSAINKQLSENLKETMEKNNIITAYRLLVERYKNMSFIDRLFNRQPDENDLRPDMIKDTYVLDQSKEE